MHRLELVMINLHTKSEILIYFKDEAQDLKTIMRLSDYGHGTFAILCSYICQDLP